ncbi:hypothetical protein ACFLZN_02485 [Nanoarchaeota archaeon]
MDKEKLKQVASTYLFKYDYVGTFVGGSGHLGDIRVTNMEVTQVKETEIDGKKCYEVKVDYETYTETEFEHDPDDPAYVNHSSVTFYVDEEYNIVETEKERTRSIGNSRRWSQDKRGKGNTEVKK